MTEAPLARGGAGLAPVGEGWFIVNVADAEGMATERFGMGARFEGADGFPGFGINVRVLDPGTPASLYHRESAGEAFLVLSGECVAVVEDAERPMAKGDFLYTPPGTAHVLVGAGESPCSILMAGARPEGDLEISFPVSDAAARHGASVEEETSDPRVAYAGTRRLDPATIGLPW